MLLASLGLVVLAMLAGVGGGTAFLWQSNRPARVGGYTVLGPNCGYGARVVAEQRQSERVLNAMRTGRPEPRVWNFGPFGVYPP